MKLLTRLPASILATLLHRVLRYRLKVITANLQRVFNYTNQRELQYAVKCYYRYLGKIAFQILLPQTRKRLLSNITMDPYPQIDTWLSGNQSVIVVMGHTGNWEWAGAYIMMSYFDHACALYKKIKDKRINAILHTRRSRSAKFLVDSSQPAALLRLMKQQPVVILMIADQNPGSDQGIIWTNFLGLETAFANGPESIGARYQLPVLYAHVTPRPDGKYHIHLVPLYDGKEKMEYGDITRRFATALEENIRDHQYEWLWSHRRWKRNRTDN